MSLGFSRILLCSSALGILLYSPAISLQSHLDSTQTLNHKPSAIQYALAKPSQRDKPEQRAKTPQPQYTTTTNRHDHTPERLHDAARYNIPKPPPQPLKLARTNPTDPTRTLYRDPSLRQYAQANPARQPQYNPGRWLEDTQPEILIQNPETLTQNPEIFTQNPEIFTQNPEAFRQSPVSPQDSTDHAHGGLFAGGFYVSASSSANFPNSADFTNNLDPGFAVSGAIGYYGWILGLIRPDYLREELEVSYSRSETSFSDGDRTLENINIMANIYVDMLGSKAEISPYIGFGVGGSNIKISRTGSSSVDKWFTSIAAMAGARTYLTDNLHASLEYKYFHSFGDLYFDNMLNFDDLYSHNIGLKLGYDF